MKMIKKLPLCVWLQQWWVRTIFTLRHQGEVGHPLSWQPLQHLHNFQVSALIVQWLLDASLKVANPVLLPFKTT
jgi:hypothetical protein